MLLWWGMWLPLIWLLGIFVRFLEFTYKEKGRIENNKAVVASNSRESITYFMFGLLVNFYDIILLIVVESY